MQFLHAFLRNYFIIFFPSSRSLAVFVGWKTCLLPEGWIANVFGFAFGFGSAYFKSSVGRVLLLLCFFFIHRSRREIEKWLECALLMYKWSIRTLSNSSSHQNWYKIFRWCELFFFSLSFLSTHRWAGVYFFSIYLSGFVLLFCITRRNWENKCITKGVQRSNLTLKCNIIEPFFFKSIGWKKEQKTQTLKHEYCVIWR